MFSAPHAPSSPRGRQFAGTYHQVGVQTMVDAATPHGLVAMLFDGFIAAVNRAKGALRSQDIAAKGLAIGHAVRIVDEGLRSGLNLREGGKLAADLADLYAYVCMRLTQANLHNDEAALDECLGLVAPLRDAWAGIADRAEAQVQAS